MAGSSRRPRGKPGRSPRAQRSPRAGALTSSETLRSSEKLQKVLARAALGSRRELEDWIRAGRVRVNGRLAKLGARVGPDDRIEVDGNPLTNPLARGPVTRVVVYNKRAGEICSRRDPEGRPTCFDALPKAGRGRWIAVGRLDFNTSGLLLFTTDGELANRLMHPSAELDREYAVRIRGEVDEAILQRLRSGVELEDGVAHFSDVQPYGGEGANRWYHCVLMEGRNREVRRLWESQGVQVSRLKRVRFGPVVLPSRVTAGRWLELRPEEVDALCRVVSLPEPHEGAHRKRLKHSKLFVPYPGLTA